MTYEQTLNDRIKAGIEKLVSPTGWTVQDKYDYHMAVASKSDLMRAGIREKRQAISNLLSRRTLG